MSGLVGRILQIRPEEWRTTRLALVFAFLLLYSAVFSRTVADALFLSTFDPSWVPTYIAAGALGSVLFSGLYMGLVRRGRAGAHINAWMMALLSFISIAAASAGAMGGDVGLWIFAVGIMLVGPAANTVGWNVLTAMFHSRQSKRLLPLVGAAGTLGAVAGGLTVRPLIGAVGTFALVVPAGLIFVALIPLPRLAAALSPEEPQPSKGVPFAENLAGGFKAIRATPLVATLAGIMFLLSISTNLVDVTFLTALQSRGRDDIGMFLGGFHAATNGSVLLLQTFVLGRVFARFGVRWTFLAYPAVLLAGAGIVVAFPLFYVVAAYRGMDKVLKFTGHYGGMDLVLSPVSDDVRDRARAFLRGACVPGGALVAGAVATPIAWLGDAETTKLLTCGAIAVSSLLALMLARRLRRHYVDELRRALRIRVVRVEATPSLKMGMEGDVARLLAEAIETGDAYLQNFALDIFAENFEDRSHLNALLRHRLHTVRRAAMEAVAKRPTKKLGRAIREHLPREKSPEVLAIGLGAVRESLGNWGGPMPASLLTHEDIDVRAAALLLELVGNRAVGAAPVRAAVAEWAAGTQKERRAAARLLEGLNRAKALGPDDRALLSELLKDDDPEVRIDAVRAAGPLGDAEAIDRLVALLGDQSVRASAEAALAEVGRAAVPPLRAAALDDSADPRLRHAALHALSRIRHLDALKAVGDILVVPETHLRSQAAAAIRTLRRHLGDKACPRDALLAAMHWEMKSGYRAAGLWEERVSAGLGLEALLLDALRDRMNSATDALFGLAGALHGADWVEQVLMRYRTGSARTQADAVEVLDVLLQDSESRAMLAFLDQSTPEAKAREAPNFLDLPPDRTFTEEVLAGPDRHAALCLVRAGLPEGIEAPPDLVKEVRIMGDQFERVLLLKSVPLFSELAGEDLLPVAEVARDIVVEPGARVVTQGETGDDLYVVVRGKVRIVKDGEDLGEIGDRGSFGELALLDREPRAATVIAVDRTDMLRIGRQEFQDLLDAHPALTRGILRVLLGYVRGGRMGTGSLRTLPPGS